MEKYLVTYEYELLVKIAVVKRTETRVFTIDELENINNHICCYGNYLKILSCYKL